MSNLTESRAERGAKKSTEFPEVHFCLFELADKKLAAFQNAVFCGCRRWKGTTLMSSPGEDQTGKSTEQNHPIEDVRALADLEAVQGLTQADLSVAIDMIGCATSIRRPSRG